jgi:hypothetical protein
MNVGDIGVGVGLSVWGAAFYALSTWYVRDDVRMRKLAESRGRSTEGKGRSGVTRCQRRSGSPGSSTACVPG